MNKLEISTLNLSREMLNHLKIGARELLFCSIEGNYIEVEKLEKKLRKQLRVIEGFVEDEFIQENLIKVGTILDVARNSSKNNLNSKLILLSNVVNLVDKLTHREIEIVKDFIISIEGDIESNLSRITLDTIKRRMNIISIRSSYNTLFITANFDEIYEELNKCPHEVLVEIYKSIKRTGMIDKLSSKERYMLTSLYDERLPF